MKYDYKKHKLIGHILLGLHLLIHFHFILNSFVQDNWIWFGVVICVAFTALIAERVQLFLGIGTNTAQGALRTCIPLIPYFVYNFVLLIIS